jgi:diaminopimelate decarboxylase
MSILYGFNHFEGTLHADGVSLTTIATAVGTPFYCYSTAIITRQVEAYRSAFVSLDTAPLIAFAVKANPNIAVLQTLGELGAGADVVTIGELRRALTAGIPAKSIVFSGVGKTADEMATAMREGIFQFNIESENEAAMLSDVATTLGLTASVAIRVNPLVDAKTHPKIATGLAENKFGIPIGSARAAYHLIASLPGLDPCGLAIHIGSQLTSLEPIKQSLTAIGELMQEIRTDGLRIDRIDVGGGLGISYGNHLPNPPTIADYGAVVIEATRDWGVALILEPGRSIVAEAGILVSRVIRTKNGAVTKFLIVDAAMNDLLRPTLYDAWHDIEPLVQTNAPIERMTVVGPICETGDTFATDRDLPAMEEGDLVAFRAAGAYGATMASTYNARPLVAEVLVASSKFAVVRHRQKLEDMWANENFATWQSA